MYTVIVTLQVRPGRLEDFRTGLQANARASLRDEPGCLRFDVHQDLDDPHRFLLHEVYRDQTAFTQDHRQAPHYAAWREAVTACVVPGSHHNTYYRPAFPQDITNPAGQGQHPEEPS